MAIYSCLEFVAIGYWFEIVPTGSRQDVAVVIELLVRVILDPKLPRDFAVANC